MIAGPQQTLKTLCIGLLALLWVSAAGAVERSRKIDLPGSELTNFYQVDSTVYRSDQPSRQDFRALKIFGIREVLNLRNFHNDLDEAEGLGFVLHRVDMRAGKVTEAQLMEAMRIIRDRQGPILVHCWHGSDRTGVVIATYRILFQGLTKEEAIEDMTQGGYGFHKTYDNLPELLRSLDVEKMKRELGL